MADSTERDDDRPFRDFVESSESVLFIELDAQGVILRTNRAAELILSQFGVPEGKPLAPFLLGLESARLEDFARLCSGAERRSRSVVELATPDRPPARFVFSTRKLADRMLLFGEPSADELHDLRRQTAGLRDHYEDAMRRLGRQAVEQRRLLTGLEEAGRQLERNARTDPVTGLSNRREFLRVARQEWVRYQRYGRTYSVTLGEVTGMDDLIRSEGLAAGEAALVMVAELVATRLRRSDYSARFGDRQFAVLACEIGAATARRVAERLRAVVAERNIAPPTGGGIGLVVGLSEVAPDDQHPEDVVRRASAALRETEESGGSRSDGPGAV